MVPSALDSEVSAACYYCKGRASGGYFGLTALQEAEVLAERLTREGAVLKRLRTAAKTISGEILFQALLHLADSHWNAREAGHSGRSLAQACYTLAEILRGRPQVMARMYIFTEAGTIRAAHGACLVSAVLTEVGPRPKVPPQDKRRGRGRGRRTGPPQQPSLVDLWDAAQERRRQEEQACSVCGGTKRKRTP
jgi:hypothetical protein